MGLAPLMVMKIYETIAAIAREGVTILLVEQNANLALRVSQRAYVMESGEPSPSRARPRIWRPTARSAPPTWGIDRGLARFSVVHPRSSIVALPQHLQFRIPCALANNRMF
jgi:energy-coupling factor transporter ATP-binding protein EcfA2